MKLSGTEIERILFENSISFRGSGPVYSSHLIKLIDEKCNNQKIVQTADQIRTVEEKVRNIAAHQICSITDEQIRELTGCMPDEISKRIKELFLFAGFSIRREEWDCYEEMNQFILNKMEIVC